MSERLRTELSLVGDGIRFEARAEGREPVYVDYTPPIGGGEGYTSLELLLISVGSCLATVVKLQAARIAGGRIESLSAQIEGDRRTEHPTSFEEIRITLRVEAVNIERRRLEEIMRVAEEQICPLFDIIRGNCRVKTELNLVRSVPA